MAHLLAWTKRIILYKKEMASSATDAHATYLRVRAKSLVVSRYARSLKWQASFGLVEADLEGSGLMDVTDELLLSLLGGLGQGTAKAATLGTTTAAVALWARIRKQFRRRRASLTEEERKVLETKPGEQVNAEVLRGLLQKLPESDLKYSLSIYQTTVGGDWISHGGTKNVYNIGSPGDD
jgi:hypothetical protein